MDTHNATLLQNLEYMPTFSVETDDDVHYIVENREGQPSKRAPMLEPFTNHVIASRLVVALNKEAMAHNIKLTLGTLER